MRRDLGSRLQAGSQAGPGFGVLTGIALFLPAVVAGAVIIGFVLQDVFEVLLLPRRVRRRWRLSGLFFKATWALWRLSARLFRHVRPRAGFLSIYGPLSVVTLYVTWASSLILGFGLCQWGLHQRLAVPSSLWSNLYLSGSTFFTLGFGDVTPRTGLAKLVAVAEAGSGFGLIAAVIGYLPVLYQLFSRREAHVIQLDARAGSPPSAVALLAGHGDTGAMADLDAFLRAWEIWGAELLESHLSYPVLAFYRSQHDNQSWLGALSTIMDTCAIVLSGLEGARTFQARMTFAMGRMVIIEMVRVLRLSPVTHQPERLAPECFEELVERLRGAGLAFDSTEAEQRLAAFRTTYEPFIEALARYLATELPGWLPSGEPDNWQTSSHGELAKSLIDEA
jgi:hypothetical protein